MPKRGEHIHKRKDGRWEARYKCGISVAGKTLYKSVYLEFFARKCLRGFLRPKRVRSNTLEYVGPIAVPLYDRLKKPIRKYDFFFLIEQIVDATQKLQKNALPWNKVVWDLRHAYINETTKEVQLIYEEKSVVTDVRYIATDALELNRQSKWQAFCQWAYGTFCVDMLNWNPVTRFIGNGIKKGLDWVQEKGTKIVDWFKHGEGKYYLGIALDALAVVGAIAGTVVAIALAVATGGAAAPLVVAAVASTIGTVMTMVDSGFSIYNKVKALKVEKETGDPGRARYYGNISGVSDTIDKTDMGGKTANDVWGVVGTGYDVIHVAADITAVVSGTIGAAGLSGQAVKNPVTGKFELKTTYDPSKIKSNLKGTFLEKIGFRNKGGKWTFNIKNLFSTKRPTGTMPRTDVFKKDIIGDKIGDTTYKTINKIKKYSGLPGKYYKKATQIEKIFTLDSSGYDKFKNTMKYIGGTDFNISSPVGDFNGTVLEIIDTVINIAS